MKTLFAVLLLFSSLSQADDRWWVYEPHYCAPVNYHPYELLDNVLHSYLRNRYSVYETKDSFVLKLRAPAEQNYAIVQEIHLFRNAEACSKYYKEQDK